MFATKPRIVAVLGGWRASLFAVLAVAAVICFLGADARAARSGARADAAEQRAEALAGELANTRNVLSTERQAAKALAEVAAQYEQDKRNAQVAQERVVADLRAGNLRLRKLWEAERATDELADAATAARHADELAQLRREAAGRIVRVGAEADAQVRGLQKVVRKDREVLEAARK
jgi:GTP1/Obg family GTP-binding protein